MKTFIVDKNDNVKQFKENSFLYCKELNKGIVTNKILNDMFISDYTVEQAIQKLESLGFGIINTPLNSVGFNGNREQDQGTIKYAERRHQEVIKDSLSLSLVTKTDWIQEEKHESRYFDKTVLSIHPRTAVDLVKAGVTEDGIYTLSKTGLKADEKEVYCDLNSDGGGWELEKTYFDQSPFVSSINNPRIQKIYDIDFFHKEFKFEFDFKMYSQHHWPEYASGSTSYRRNWICSLDSKNLTSGIETLVYFLYHDRKDGTWWRERFSTSSTNYKHRYNDFINVPLKYTWIQSSDSIKKILDKPSTDYSYINEIENTDGGTLAKPEYFAPDNFNHLTIGGYKYKSEYRTYHRMGGEVSNLKFWKRYN